ncbi:MAG: ribosomal protein S18-alanine N-acetyltransferase [Deltaproteobacteria bacterium]|nr:ribosomal protein S18-alanine N-acetyltransferase [Deltaproteobacteria bacterium]
MPWTADDYERELARPFSRLRVAEPAGGGTIGGFSNYWIVADEVHLLKVATAPTLRRQGVARSLLRELLEEGRRCHCRLVTLEVRRSNDAAGALYASLGFQTAGVRRRYYENGEDALVMLLCPLPA